MIENQRLEIIAPFGREKKVSREYASVFSPGRKDFFIKKLSSFAPFAPFARNNILKGFSQRQQRFFL